MTVPFAFANLSGNIALAKLDSNFNTPITIGNTSVLLGNTVTTLNNLTLANVTITSGTSNVTNVNVTNVNVTNLTATLANVTTLNVASAFITSANIGTLALTNALPVPSGGTGQVTFPANSVLVGNGTGGIATVAPGNVGNVLTSIGGAWVSNVAMSGAAAGSNTQVQYNNSGALAGSANLTFNGTTLTANTLNLTNALGTTYGGTGLTSFTSGGVVYASSSSALATGSALTFDGTNLGVGGTAGIGLPVEITGTTSGVSFKTSASNFTYGACYTTTSLMLIQAGQSGTGAYVPIAFSVSGSERMRLDSSGNLLVGETSAGYSLAGRGLIEVNGSASSLYAFRVGSVNKGYLLHEGTNLYVSNDVSGALIFATNGTEQARISSNGNVGIGTAANASAILDAQSTTKGVRMPNMTTTQKNAISSPAAGLMVFDTTLAKLCVYSGSAWQTITSV